MASDLLINNNFDRKWPVMWDLQLRVEVKAGKSRNMPKNILVIAALAEEADAFHPGQGVIVLPAPHPMRVIEQPDRQIKIVTCGLGKVNAALAVGRYADAGTVLVAMIGTCGRIAPQAGDTYWISCAIQHDYGARLPDGFVHYRAGDWPIGAAREPALMAMPDTGSNLPHAAIISGDVFLACPDSAAALARRLNAQLVDMEVAAIAQAAEVMGLPWCAIKAVTDDADSDSAGDFQANLMRAAQKAAVAMERVIACVI
jgi:adenosylhomocysteine nucleosidase